MLSLASCEACLILDDELNVLPLSRHAKKLVPVTTTGDDDEAHVRPVTAVQAELAVLKESVSKRALVCAPLVRATLVRQSRARRVSHSALCSRGACSRRLEPSLISRRRLIKHAQC
jgi:N-acetyltransferase 10